MRRPTISSNAAASIVALAWLLLPLAFVLGAVNRGPNSTQADSLLTAAFGAYHLMYASVSIPIAYMIWHSWRVTPPRLPWFAWNSQRHVYSAVWTLVLGAPVVMLLGAAATDALEGRFRLPPVAMLCALGFVLFRAFLVAPRVHGLESETLGLRLSRVVLLFALLLWPVTIRMDQQYSGQNWTSNSRQHSLERGVWRADPALRDSVIRAGRLPVKVRDLFVEERARVNYRWLILRDVQPLGDYTLLAVMRAVPNWDQTVELQALLYRGADHADTLRLSGMSGDARFGTIQPPFPDSVQLQAINMRTGQPIAQPAPLP